MTETPPQPPPFTPADELLVNDLETLKVIADPLRVRIRELLTTPATVKQLAKQLGMSATKLYYHINLLEKHGLITTVETRIVSGIIEKHYQIASKQIRVAPSLFESDSPDGQHAASLSIKSVLADVQEDMLTSFATGAINTAPDAPAHEEAHLSSIRLRLTEAQATVFLERLKALRDEFIALSRENQASDAPAPKRLYKWLVALFPTSRP